MDARDKAGHDGVVYIMRGQGPGSAVYVMPGLTYWMTRGCGNRLAGFPDA
ncbi:hypothetical protein [uncultured Bradyrhizobium sp.]